MLLGYSLEPPGGLLRISSDRDNQRIILGLIFSISGFFILYAYRGRVVSLKIFMARKLGLGLFGGSNFGPGIFLGFCLKP